MWQVMDASIDGGCMHDGRKSAKWGCAAAYRECRSHASSHERSCIGPAIKDVCRVPSPSIAPPRFRACVVELTHHWRPHFQARETAMADLSLRLHSSPHHRHHARVYVLYGRMTCCTDSSTATADQRHAGWISPKSIPIAKDERNGAPAKMAMIMAMQEYPHVNTLYLSSSRSRESNTVTRAREILYNTNQCSVSKMTVSGTP